MTALALETKGDMTLRKLSGDSGIGGPKVVKGTFNLAVSTSKFTPDELVAEALRVLTMLNIFFVHVSIFLLLCALSVCREWPDEWLDTVRSVYGKLHVQFKP